MPTPTNTLWRVEINRYSGDMIVLLCDNVKGDGDGLIALWDDSSFEIWPSMAFEYARASMVPADWVEPEQVATDEEVFQLEATAQPVPDEPCS